jgi:hypothetical protein
MAKKHLILIGIGLCILGYVAGYFSPRYVETHNKEIKKSVKVQHKVKRKNNIVTVKKPDGTVTTTDTSTVVSNTDVKKDVIKSDKYSLIKRDENKFNVTVYVISPILSAFQNPLYGATVSYKVMGPFNVSVFADSKFNVGVGFGFSF